VQIDNDDDNAAYQKQQVWMYSCRVFNNWLCVCDYNRLAYIRRLG